MVYHVYNKSIADYRIFNNDDEFLRMTMALCYYTNAKPQISLGNYLKLAKTEEHHILEKILTLSKEHILVNIIAYCLMPTHLHLILKEIKETNISIFMNNTLNSYTHYFNTRHRRKGPLWEGRSKKVQVETDEQLLHLTRYIHLNPVTGYLVDKPEYWKFSSYREYISDGNIDKKICKYDDILKIDPESYRGFVEERIDYQRELARLKDLVLE